VENIDEKPIGGGSKMPPLSEYPEQEDRPLTGGAKNMQMMSEYPDDYDPNAGFTLLFYKLFLFEK
jgi:hypothetical protein